MDVQDDDAQDDVQNDAEGKLGLKKAGFSTKIVLNSRLGIDQLLLPFILFVVLRVVLYNLKTSITVSTAIMPRERKPKGDPDAEGAPKPKRRRGSAAKNAANQANQVAGRSGPQMDMVPPPPAGFGDTVFAGNPFDDFAQPPPPPNQGMPPQGPHPGHPNMGPPYGHPMAPPHHHGQPGPHMHGPPHGLPQSGHPQAGHPGMKGPPHPGMMSGKIYPPDQARVFNPANPNAPPIYPCGICHKEVHDNDQAILCESGCNFWYHRGCTGLTEHAFVLLNEEIFAEWACDKCMSTKNIPCVKLRC